MNELLKELNDWLETKINEEMENSMECNSWEEVSRQDALEWCADGYKTTLNKIQELKKKYKL